jgi:hypothetical protein
MLLDRLLQLAGAALMLPSSELLPRLLGCEYQVEQVLDVNVRLVRTNNCPSKVATE